MIMSELVDSWWFGGDSSTAMHRRQESISWPMFCIARSASSVLFTVRAEAGAGCPCLSWK